MHHLKTMVEAFIYYHVVGADLSDAVASLVLAKTYDDKAKFYRENKAYGFAADADVARWEQARDELLCGKDARRALKSIENLAELAKGNSTNLGAWYARAYRMAAEPAHLGDLQELMPIAGRIVTVGQLGEYRAVVALDMALQLSIGLLHAIGEMNEPNIRVPTSPLEERLAAIRRMSV
jgi:hypothetical protein